MSNESLSLLFVSGLTQFVLACLLELSPDGWRWVFGLAGERTDPFAEELARSKMHCLRQFFCRCLKDSALKTPDNVL